MARCGGGADNERYVTEITLFAHDRRGLLADVSRVLAEEEIDINSVNTRTSKQGIATMTISFETAGIDEITHLMSKLRQVEGVVDIQRTVG